MASRGRVWIGVWVLAAGGGWLAVCAGNEPSDDALGKPGRREPVSLVLLDGESRLAVGNRSAGTVSVVDCEAGTVLAEVRVAERLADLVSLDRSGGRLLGVDEGAGRLVGISRSGAELRELASVEVGSGPVSVSVGGDGAWCTVARMWGRELVRVAIGGGAQEIRLEVSGRVMLPFSPRRQLWLSREKRLLVSDAFGGRLAVVDVERGRVESVRELPVHNIGGLAVSDDGQTLLLTHQILNASARTDANDVHWGLLITNILRFLPVSNVLNAEVPATRGGRSVMMGEVGRAGGDPLAILQCADKKIGVVLGGVGALMVVEAEQAVEYRVGAGQRPTCGVVAAGGRSAWVADSLGDRLFEMDVLAGEVRREVALGPERELTEAERGERLFYDARISHDGWMSCHSCHVDGHTNGLRNDNLGDDSLGAPKRVPSLLGAGRTGPWGWNGKTESLEEQVRRSVASTMRGRGLRDEQVRDLVAYVRSLSPPPRGNVETALAERGRDVFRQQDCGRCHAGEAYTSEGVYDVGLADERGVNEFNPPSLIGVRYRDRLFHDNRAGSLEEVFGKYEHQTEGLSAEERTGLIEFLRGL